MSSVNVRRRWGRAKPGTAPKPPITLTLRTRVPLRRDTGVHYAGGVAPRKIDREEWARQVAQLVAEETGGNKSRFAAKVGATYKTVNRWLNGEVDVREESVRDVARALGVSTRDLLVRVGYYLDADLDSAPASPDPQSADEVVRMVLESRLPPHLQRRMLDRLQRLRESQRTHEADEVRFWIEQARRS